jgi:hypothetical protein
MHRYIVLLLAFTMTACASSRGFDRGNLRNQIADQKVVTEDDIKKALELKPQLPAPFKLAVFFAQPKSGWSHGSSWNWRGEDKDALIQMKSDLIKKNIISDMFVLSDSILEGTDNKAIRLAAARGGADAVLIVNGVSSVDRYNNAWGGTYFLIITPFFVPGTVADGLVMINASMWDIRNQYLYLSAEAEGTARQRKPAFFIDENHLINDARSNAVAALRKEVLMRLDAMGSK